ncbi:MAG: hypothetical protein ABF649_20160 [Bacillus sp. (in: firmicutes)]
MKRIFLGFVFLIGVIIFPSLSSASIMETDASFILTDYLQAVKNQDAEKMIDYVQDERYTESKDPQLTEYSEKVHMQQLVNYEIVQSQFIDASNKQYDVLLTFDNGEISKVSFTMVRYNNVWKVHIPLDSLKKQEDYELIEEGTPIAPPTSKAPLKGTRGVPSTTLTTWSFSNKASDTTFYLGNIFNITGKNATLTGTQTHKYVSQDLAVKITYQVVQKHWYGDTVWSAATRSGNGSFSIDLIGTGNMTGLTIKLQTGSSPIENMGYSGSGKLIQYN